MTLLEMINDLINRFETRKRYVDDILELLKNTVENSNGAIKQVEKTALEMEHTFKEMSDLTIKISKDYDNLKSKLNSNFWLKLFGVKV
jgi:predicted translin family RNA/ssDNA-binding protein